MRAPLQAVLLIVVCGVASSWAVAGVIDSDGAQFIHRDDTAKVERRPGLFDAFPGISLTDLVGHGNIPPSASTLTGIDPVLSGTELLNSIVGQIDGRDRPGNNGSPLAGSSASAAADDLFASIAISLDAGLGSGLNADLAQQPGSQTMPSLGETTLAGISDASNNGGFFHPGSSIGNHLTDPGNASINPVVPAPGSIVLLLGAMLSGRTRRRKQ